MGLHGYLLIQILVFFSGHICLLFETGVEKSWVVGAEGEPS